MSKFSTFRSLSSQQKKILLQSIFLLPLLRIALQLISFRRLMDILKRTSRNRYPGMRGPQAIAGTEQMVRAAGQYRIMLATCLTRSMALWWLLRRQGIESEIRFGVRRENGQFMAHAWVEKGGLVINDRPDVRDHYATFDSVPSQSGLNWR